MKIGKYVGKALIRAFGVLLLIFVLAFCSFLIVRAVGKSSLYGTPTAKAPRFQPQEVPAGEILEDDMVYYNGTYYRYNKDILTFLVMGTDSLEKLPKEDEVTDYTKGGQADTLFLVVINPHLKDVKVIAINRNSMTEVDVYDEENTYIRTDLLQVCLQHGYGSGREDSCERQVATVSRMFFDLPIHGYFAMNMAAVPILNDSVGGVRLKVLENVPWGTDAIARGQGNYVTLEGMDAYYYLQYRDVEVFDSASMRLARQKQYLGAFARRMIEKTSQDITFPLDVLNALKDYAVTDVDAAKITYLVSAYIGYDFNMDGILSLEGETIVGGGGFEEFYVDDEALYELILSVFYEETQA